jgi:hypothetical protein
MSTIRRVTLWTKSRALPFFIPLVTGSLSIGTPTLAVS